MICATPIKIPGNFVGIPPMPVLEGAPSRSGLLKRTRGEEKNRRDRRDGVEQTNAGSLMVDGRLASGVERM
jgi:hypothetical protein